MGMDGDGWDGISKMDGRYFGFLDTYLNLKQRLYLSKKWTRASWAGWALAGLVGRGGRGEEEEVAEAQQSYTRNVAFVYP